MISGVLILTVNDLSKRAREKADGVATHLTFKLRQEMRWIDIDSLFSMTMESSPS